MSRSRRRWPEEPSSSRHERSYYDTYSRGQGWGHRDYYAPPTEFCSRRTFDYRRDEPLEPASHYPQRRYPYEQESRGGDDGRSWCAESSNSRRRRSFDRGRSLDGRDLRGDRSPGRVGPSQRTSRHYHTTYTPPYIPPRTLRARSPLDSSLSFPELAPPIPPPKMSPPPIKPPVPLGPNFEYLALSQESSVVLLEPGANRKLLVLDLNGTLLIRSPRSQSASRQQLRAVHPRPYMQPLREYLFCTKTKAWLDTMVWSSAQPHSVDDMVDKVFGTTKNELKTVWNRKSLGLSEAEYHQKTLTTKDLTKPWNLFASALNPEQAGPSQPQTIHSALTTLLFDDSPHKAALQPYNHVCLPEYDRTRRQHDLQHFLATNQPKERKQNKKVKRRSQAETATHTNQTIAERSASGVLSESEEEPYDAVLLAIVGILEAVKLQSNVAGWIRKGGLWATQERGVNVLDVGKAKAGSSTAVGIGNDANTTFDPAVIPEQAHLQTKMWFDDSSVLDYWIGQGRKALMELDIQVVCGITG